MEKLPELDEPEEELNLQVSKSMSGTLTQSIMNFIKMKVSKRDAMRVSTAAAVTSSSVVKHENIGLPPLSPQKKKRVVPKTEINF